MGRVRGLYEAAVEGEVIVVTEQQEKNERKRQSGDRRDRTIPATKNCMS